MNEIIMVSIAQFIMIFLKHFNVRIIQNGKRYKASLVTVGIQSMWLISTSIGVKAMLGKDWVVVVAYLISGALGSIMSFKIKA